MERAAIIGFGCAGYHGLKALREHGFSGQVDVYEPTGLPPANPMLTTYYTAGKLPYEGMFPFGGLEEINAQYPFQFRKERVNRLLAKEKTLVLEGGTKESYTAILISTGAEPFIPPIGSYPKDRVYVMRSVADAQRMKERLQGKKIERAVVVGASMAGIKVAEVLSNLGAQCLLADLAPRIFPLAALPETAAEIQNRVEKKGVQLAFGVGLSGITPEGDGVAVHFGDRVEQGDLAVLCIGTRPSLSFIDPSEVEVDRGILVNQRMETSAPGVYAAGDCCQGRNLQSNTQQVIGLWANAGIQGETAGCAIVGGTPCYEGSFPHNITHFMGMDFIGLGDVKAQGEPYFYQKPDGSFQLRAVFQQGRLACVNILDNYAISGVVKNYMVKRFLGESDPISPMQKVALLRSGLTPGVIQRLEGIVHETK